MVRVTRAVDWANLMLGLYVLAVPLFTANSADGSTVFVGEVVGGTVALAALRALARPASVVAEWSQAVAGLLLLVAPSLFSYTELVAATCHARLIGTVVTVLALSAVPAARRAARRSPEDEWRDGNVRERLRVRAGGG